MYSLYLVRSLVYKYFPLAGLIAQGGKPKMLYCDRSRFSWTCSSYIVLLPSRAWTLSHLIFVTPFHSNDSIVWVFIIRADDTWLNSMYFIHVIVRYYRWHLSAPGLLKSSYFYCTNSHTVFNSRTWKERPTVAVSKIIGAIEWSYILIFGGLSILQRQWTRNVVICTQCSFCLLTTFSVIVPFFRR